MKLNKILPFIILYYFSGSLYANEGAMNKSIAIVNNIIGICQTKGMLTCQKNIEGVDIVFEYIKLFDQVSALDAKFKEFLAQNYPSEAGFDFDVMQASLNLSMEITFTPEQFASRITDAKKVSNGYDVVLDNGPIFQLRKKNKIWIVLFSPELSSQFKQVESFYTAGRLKRSIIIYRMLEAKMAGLTKDELEENVSVDIAPIMIAMFGEKNFPTLMKWLSKDISEVADFYSKFTTIDDMRTYISKIHGLSIKDNKRVN